MIGDTMPVIEHSPAACAEKTRAIDHIGHAVQQRFQKQRILVRIIFKIRVLDKRVLSGGMVDCRAYRCTFAPILRTADQSYQIGVTFRHLLDELWRSIGGSVIDDNNLALQPSWKWSTDHSFQDRANKFCFIVQGNEN